MTANGSERRRGSERDGPMPSRPPAAPAHAPRSYRFSLGYLVRWLATAPLATARSLEADARGQLPRQGGVDVEGVEHVPATGPFIAVINHYERPGMRMWWTAMCAAYAIAEARRGTRIRWFSTDRLTGWSPYGVTVVPGAAVRWFMRLVTRRYELLPVNPTDPADRARALREAHRTLHRDGRPVGIAPEAGNRGALGRELITPVAGSGAALALLSGGTVPVLPLAVWEDEAGSARACFGPTFMIERSGAGGASERVMRALAALLPPELRGPYREPST